MKETFDKIVDDVKEIVEKTGSEANLLADGVKSKLNSMEKDVKSMDLSAELVDISHDIDEMAQKTGLEAKEIANITNRKIDIFAEKINLGKNFDIISRGINDLIEVTGDEAADLVGRIIENLKKTNTAIKSVDVGVEINDISEDLGELAQKRGSEAKTLAANTNQKLDILAEKVNLGKNFDIIFRGIDDLIDATGDEAAELVGHVMDYLKKVDDSVRSVDVKEEIREISGKLKALAGKTGKEAESVAKDIKESIRKLQYKLFG